MRRVVDGLASPVVIADEAGLELPALIGEECRAAFIVYDARVEPRARRVAEALRAAKTDVRGQFDVVVDASTKRAETVAALYDALLAGGADRSTWIVAIGGGTLTDAVGFAASTYMRGVPWAVVATTVLCMADAAIGGKTAIDLPQGKNLAGTFWPPRAVVGDLTALASLSARERATGLAEIVKCGVIEGEGLLGAVDRVLEHGTSEMWGEAIAGAARAKASVVRDDPFERGPRAVLNLGHTVGHALEAATSYRLAHGEAVAIGLRAAGLLAQSRGWWPSTDHARMLGLLRRAGLPLRATDVSADAVMMAMRTDKKNVDGRLRFVLPVRIGDVRYGVDVETDDVRRAVDAVRTAPARDEIGG